LYSDFIARQSICFSFIFDEDADPNSSFLAAPTMSRFVLIIFRHSVAEGEKGEKG
jgi:hypothetical protein